MCVYVYDTQNMCVQNQPCSSAVLSRVSSRSDKAAVSIRTFETQEIHVDESRGNFVPEFVRYLRERPRSVISRASQGTIEIPSPTTYRNALIAPRVSREGENSGIIPVFPEERQPRSDADFKFSGRSRDDIGSRESLRGYAVCIKLLLYRPRPQTVQSFPGDRRVRYLCNSIKHSGGEPNPLVPGQICRDNDHRLLNTKCRRSLITFRCFSHYLFTLFGFLTIFYYSGIKKNMPLKLIFIL